jgi:tRNA threonylcarbamoyladenosine biosynthesis protein TsaB
MLLAIEASDRGGGIAFAEEGSIIELEYENSRRTHSERLMPIIDSLLKKRGRSYDDITAIAVSRGPGSFTAIRLGVTTAKTLAFCCGVPLISASNLRLLAEFGRNCGMPVEAVMGARRGELYRQRFLPGPDGLEAGFEPQLIRPEQLIRELNDGEDVLLVYRGRGWSGEEENWSENVRVYPPRLAQVLVAPLANLALERLQRGEQDDIDELRPSYIRRSDAQRSRDKAR